MTELVPLTFLGVFAVFLFPVLLEVISCTKKQMTWEFRLTDGYLKVEYHSNKIPAASYDYDDTC